MRVRCALGDHVYMVGRSEHTESIYTVYDDKTGGIVGTAENDLNLFLQCCAKGWTLINPPRRKQVRKA
jgi:hypothetical protein